MFRQFPDPEVQLISLPPSFLNHFPLEQAMLGEDGDKKMNLC